MIDQSVILWLIIIIWGFTNFIACGHFQWTENSVSHKKPKWPAIEAYLNNERDDAFD